MSIGLLAAIAARDPIGRGAGLCLHATEYGLGQHSAVAKALSPEEHPMGDWLCATLGAGYAALESPGHWRPAPLPTPPPGTYEAWLRTGPPASWLSLSRLALTDANAWLFESQLLGDINRAAARNQFVVPSLRGEFDAVFLRDSTPTYFLP